MNSLTRWCLVMAAILTAGGVIAAEQKEQKIAFINMERVFDEYHKTKTANAQFKKRGEEIDVQRKELIDKAKGIKAELDKLAAESRDKSLNDKAREKKKDDAENKLEQLKDAETKVMEFDKTYKKEISDQMRQLQQQIVGEIRGVIQSYAIENKIDIVLDNSGKTLNNVEAVMYFDLRADITGPIMAIMNKNAPDTGKKIETK